MKQDAQAGAIAQIARIREAANLFIEQELDKRGIQGILPAHGTALQFLFEQDQAVPIKELVSKAGRVKSTVTGIVNTLERYGYVRKFSCDEDGRCVLVQLTKQGQGLRKAFEEISERLLAKFYGKMSPDDREKLVELLACIALNMKT